MKKYILSLIIFAFSLGQSFGQQEASYIFYNQYEGRYNPSAIPSEYILYHHNLLVGATANTQWTNLSSAPKTQFLRAEYITKNDHTFNLLMGGYITHDKAGPIATTGAFFRLAGLMSKYDHKLGGISAGLQVGAVQYSVNTSSLRIKYPTDILTSQNAQTTRPQLSLGVSYYNRFEEGIFRNSNLNTGISITHLGFNELTFNDEANEFHLHTDMHYYAYAKFRKEFYDVQALELNTWIKYVKYLPTNIDVHLIFDISDVFSVEVGGNSAGIAHGGVGVNLFDFWGAENNLLHLSYGFNPSFLQAGRAFGNSHEISVSYSFQ